MLAVTVGLFASALTASAQSDAVSDLLSRVNALRVQNGLAPYALNDQLTAAAQRHSQDMAATGTVSHTGSDESTTDQRIRAAGYGQWPTFGVWGEDIYGGSSATVDIAWSFWINSTLHRNNLLNSRYREIGIGAASSANGAYYTLDFGAQPGVLPFFVDQSHAPDLVLTLSNEDAVPDGAAGRVGRAIDVRVGEGEDLSSVAWQAWRRSIVFTVSNPAGQHRITVQYRDAAKRIASYFRIVSLSGAAQAGVPTATLRPSVTPIPPTAVSTMTPTGTPQPTRTPTSIPTDTPSPSATSTSPPTATSTSTPVPTIEKPSPTATAGATRSNPEPTVAALQAAASPTPSATPIDQTPLEALAAHGWSDAPVGLLGLAAGLQIVAVLIGAAISVRRSVKP